MVRNAFKQFARLLSYAPTVAVLAFLVILGWQGHERGWRWEGKEKSNGEKKEESRVAETPESEPGEHYGFSPFDSSLPITHDPRKCDFGGRMVKEFASRDEVRKAGIRIGTVQEREMDDTLTVTATVEFDPARIARVAPRVAGFLRIAPAESGRPLQVGDPVKPRETLAIVDSPDVGKAKAAFRMARLQVDVKQQYRDTLQSGVNPPRTIMEADAAVREARLNLIAAHQALLSLGFQLDLAAAERLSDSELQALLLNLGIEKYERSPTQAANENLLPVINPLERAGHVLKQEAVTGEPVAAQQTLFIVGNTSRMMLIIDIPQEKRHRVQVNRPVNFIPDGSREKPTEGKIDWIAPEIDPKTRTVKARAFLPNPDGRLKANSFGLTRIAVRDSKQTLAVPEEAIQWEGCSHIVFVCDEDDKKDGSIEFRVRKVSLGVRQSGFVEVLGSFCEDFDLDFFHLFTDDGFVRCEHGVAPGERIAVLGSHVLKSELFRDRLGTPEE